MKDTVFLIPTAKVLVKVVDGIDAMDMNNKDIMGDVYEYLLGKIAAAKRDVKNIREVAGYLLNEKGVNSAGA